MIKINKYLFLVWLAIQGVDYAEAQQKTFTVQINKATEEINPNMWGVFFEDINMGADGGLYAELVKNRSFEFFRPMMGWKNLGPVKEGNYLILNRKAEKESNPRFLRVNTNQSDGNPIGLTNEGFRGMGIKKGVSYEFSILYKQIKPGIEIKAELIDSMGQVIGSGKLLPETSSSVWQKSSVSFTSDKTEPKAKLNIWFEGKGEIDLDMISLFPSDTWKGRKNGLRADMVQVLADLKPGFIRFPGGCIVEGFDLSQRFQWKKTVGPIEDRQLIVNRWNTEFAHRLTPDYFQTFGLGFFEYFQLAEDIGAEPLPIINCGMACQFNTGEVVPMDELDPYVQDALDLIEFANAGTDTKWGKLRSDMGHPEPFNLKMLGVGNENWGPQYIERLQAFKKVLKKHHPEIEIVASSGTDPEGERFEYLNKELRSMEIDIIDEHFYRSPEWFLSNASRYDHYDRQGPKIFAGEYASHSTKSKRPEYKNNWEAALSEAAFLTGVERNASVVQLASYAPLFAHIDGWQWTPDLIWVDNLKVYPSPSYQVQKMYSTNKGSHIVPILENGRTVAGNDKFYASAVIDKSSNELIVKLVNNSDKKEHISLDLQGVKKSNLKGKSIFLQNNDPLAINEVGKTPLILPQEKTIQVKGKTATFDAEPFSFQVVKISL